MQQLWWRCNSRIGQEISEEEKQYKSDKCETLLGSDARQNARVEEESGQQNRNMGEREWGEERRSERWNKCVRFERQWAEHALKEMPLPPSLPPCTHNQIHTNRNTLPLHCQHSTEQAFSQSHWTANGKKREDRWTRRNPTGGMSQQHSEHVLTEPHTTFMLLDHLRTGRSSVKQRSFLVTEDKSEGVRIKSTQLLKVVEELIFVIMIYEEDLCSSSSLVFLPQTWSLITGVEVTWAKFSQSNYSQSNYNWL